MTAGYVDLLAGKDYTLAFCLRSAKPREIHVSVGQSPSEREQLILRHKVEIASEWSTHFFEFHSVEEGAARLFFELGQDQAQVDIRYAIIFMGNPGSIISQHLKGLDANWNSRSIVRHRSCARATPNANAADQCVQIFLPDILIRRLARYRVSFRARADAPREIGFGVMRNEPPWNDLGIYHHIGLGRSWKPYYYEFVSIEDCDNGRILFDIGQSSIPMELEDVMIARMNIEDYEVCVS